MSRMSVDSYEVITKPNGLVKKVELHSYVVLFTEKEGEDVFAMRYNGFENQFAVRAQALEKYGKHWNIKEIRKLYDSDFEA